MFIFFAIFLALVGYLLSSISKIDRPGSLFFSIVEKQISNKSIPRSNLEWLGNISLKGGKQLKSFIVTTTFEGKVVEVSNEHGWWKIGTKYYYVGKLGYYEYAGKITLEDTERDKQLLLISTKRMNELKVFQVSNGKNTPAKFSDIRVGDKIELTETVDLTIPNQNDENLVSITIRIVK